jgi:hypothetical protein
VTESLFTSQVPVFHDASDGTVYTLGTYFTPAVDGTITAIRWWFPFTAQPFDQAVKASLFRNSDSAKLAAEPDVAFPVPGDLDQWNEVALASAISVTAGVTYCAAIRTPDRYVASTGASSPWPLTNGDLSTPADAGRFAVTGGTETIFPTNASGSGCYFVDVVFVPADVGPNEGTVDVGLDLAVSAAGATAHEGTADAGLDLAVSAAGATRHAGAVAVTLDLGLAAACVREAAGAVALGLNLAPSSAGSNGSAARVVAPRLVNRGPGAVSTSRPAPGRIVTRVRVAD